MTVEHSLEPKKFCPKCAIQGTHSPIHLFQLNDEEAIWMCKNDQCTFMPSSHWENCVVKRHWEEIPTRSSRRPFNSSSTATCVSTTSHSLRRSRSAASSAASFTTGFSSLSPWSSRAPSPADSEDSLDREPRSFVPIGPFILGGHAHTFASFETKRIEDRRRKNSSPLDNFVPVRPRSQQRHFALDSSSHKDTRRGRSLDSDSLSSSSGDSRSLTPEPSSPPETNYSSPLETDFSPWRAPYSASPQAYKPPKKVRKIFVSAKTLSKIVDSKNNLEITEVGKSKLEAETLLIESQSEPDGTASSQPPPFDDNPETDSLSLVEDNSTDQIYEQSTSRGEEHPTEQVEQPIEVAPILSIEDLQLSLVPGQTLTSSHIEAINAALAKNSAIVMKQAPGTSSSQNS